MSARRRTVSIIIVALFYWPAALALIALTFIEPVPHPLGQLAFELGIFSAVYLVIAASIWRFGVKD